MELQGFLKGGQMGLDIRTKCPAAGRLHPQGSDQMVLTGFVASPDAACGASG